MTADKYEAELQHLLVRCGGDWEKVARLLFAQHPAIVGERKKDHEQLARRFAWSSVQRRGRKPARSPDEIMNVLGRLHSIKYGRLGQLMYANRKSALSALRMKPGERVRWEKVLSGLGLPSWAAPPPLNEFGVAAEAADQFDHNPECLGCIDCQGVD